MLQTMPVAFLSDLGPMPAVLTDDYTEALAAFGRHLPRPRAVLVMSGHWEAQGFLATTAAIQPEIIYDYYGFPDSFYQVEYPCPGQPEVAGEAVRLLQAAGFAARTDPTRGLDHGAWVPLSRVYPQANVPIVQMTVPAGADPRLILAVGQAVAPLREQGVLIVGAGALLHNLRRMRFNSPQLDDWAVEFDQWISQRLDAGDLDELADYARLAPHARLAAPTPEHFDPLFFMLGAACGDKPEHFFHDLRHGNAALRIFSAGDRSDSRG